jgi:hypothetical protein
MTSWLDGRSHKASPICQDPDRPWVRDGVGASRLRVSKSPSSRFGLDQCLSLEAKADKLTIGEDMPTYGQARYQRQHIDLAITATKGVGQTAEVLSYRSLRVQVYNLSQAAECTKQMIVEYLSEVL